MTGSIWAPASTPGLNSDTSIAFERQLMAGGQIVVTLANFAYTVGISNLLVFKNGEALYPGTDFFESTTTSFTLATASLLNDVIIAVGFVGVTGTVTINDVDIFIASVIAMRNYVGTNTMLYLQNTAQPPDGSEGMFQKFTGYPAATFVDDGVSVIVPAGGDGSVGWLRSTPAVSRVALGLSTVAQAEAEAGTAATTRSWTAQRVLQAVTAHITTIVTGSFIAGLYEALANTNKYTDAEVTKVAALASSPSYFKASMAGNIPAAALSTQFAFDLEVYDPANEYDDITYKYTPQVAGLYMVNLSATYESVGNQLQEPSISIRINGTTAGAGLTTASERTFAANERESITITSFIYMNGTTDYIDASHNNDNNNGNWLGTTAGSTQTVFQAARIAP